MDDYRERLHVPLAWRPLAIPIVLILGGTVYAGRVPCRLIGTRHPAEPRLGGVITLVRRLRDG